MITFIATLAVGAITVILGIINMTGNISSLHKYHRKRVSEADRKPFGRMIGIGTVITGLAVIAFGVFFLISERTQRESFTVIGTAFMLAGTTVGMIITIIAMIKYNKGIF